MTTAKGHTIQLKPGDDEAEQRSRNRIEGRARKKLEAALERQRKAVTAKAPQSVEDAARRAQAASGGLRDILREMLQESADLGVSVAVRQFETIGYGFDWTMANQRAADWVQDYTFELVSGIERTTQARLRTAVSEWIENGRPLSSLVRDLDATFGRGRAELIASTEVTRAFAEANELAMRESGIAEGMEWRTAEDERVCPICGPLADQRVEFGQPFEVDGQQIDRPPAHPRCRCWIVPVVRDQSETTGAVEPSVAPAPEPAAAPGQRPTPVGPSLRGGLSKAPSRGKTGAVVNDVMAAIDDVHGDGDIPLVPVKFGNMSTRYGHYKSNWDGSPVEIKVSMAGNPHPRLTLAHEIGHWVDGHIKVNKKLGNAGGATAGMREFRNAAEDSAAVQRIKRIHDGEEKITYAGKEYDGDKRYARYLYSGDEVWARAYAQYVATHSGSRVLLDELEEMVQDAQRGGYPTQWTPEDFAPISRAIDKVLIEAGWLEE